MSKAFARCKHTKTTTSEPRCYTHGVAVFSQTQEPRAHGGITITEMCIACGARRDVNKNQGFREYSPWRIDGIAVRG